MLLLFSFRCNETPDQANPIFKQADIGSQCKLWNMENVFSLPCGGVNLRGANMESRANEGIERSDPCD